MKCWPRQTWVPRNTLFFPVPIIPLLYGPNRGDHRRRRNSQVITWALNAALTGILLSNLWRHVVWANQGLSGMGLPAPVFPVPCTTDHIQNRRSTAHLICNSGVHESEAPVSGY